LEDLIELKNSYDKRKKIKKTKVKLKKIKQKKLIE